MKIVLLHIFVGMRIAAQIVLFILLVFSARISGLQAQDTLRFESYREKQNVLQYIRSGNCDSFALFYYIRNTDSSHFEEDLHLMNQFADDWRKNNPDFSKEKNIKKLLNAIHKKFLIKYELNVQFYRIFREGVYNCVTSSAFYAFILRRLGIEYRVKELTTHVYLTVLLNGKEMDVETTIPQDMVVITKKQKAEYVKELEKNKIVTADEVKTKGVEKVFDEKYYQSKIINLRQLAALSYFNYALLLADSSKMIEAAGELRNSRILYPRRGTDEVIGNLLDHVANSPTKFSVKEVMRLQLSFNDLYDKETLPKLLASYSLSALFRDGNLADFLFIDSFLNPGMVRDPKKLRELKYMYSKILGEYYFKSKEYLKAVFCYHTACTLYATDIDSKYNLKECFRQYYLVCFNDSFKNVPDTIFSTVSQYPECDLDEDFQQIAYGFFSMELAFYADGLDAGKPYPKAVFDNLKPYYDKMAKRSGILLIKKKFAELFYIIYGHGLHYFGYDKERDELFKKALLLFPKDAWLELYQERPGLSLNVFGTSRDE